MQDQVAIALLITAASTALLHTLIGVDHYLPFILLGRARRWTMRQTLSVTAWCGLGHVVGSIALGGIGIVLGTAVEKLEWVEGVRGELAAYGLITFGLVYAAVSAVRAARGHRHSHLHAHEDGTLHAHGHTHDSSHTHAHTMADRDTLSYWSLFIVFVLGPCEVLIPMFMLPASAHAWSLVWGVALVFSGVTVMTMLGCVALGVRGLEGKSFKPLERHANTLAGLAIAVSGLAVQWLGA